MPIFSRSRQVKWAVYRVAAVFLAIPFAIQCEAQIGELPILEIVAESNLVLIGKVSEVGTEEARVDVTAILSGKVEGTSMVVSPVLGFGCFGPFVNFKKDEEVLLFGRGEGKRMVLAREGKMRLTVERREAQIDAARRFLAIAALDEDARNLAFLAELGSSNLWINNEAQRYVADELTESKTGKRYQKTLVDLLDHPDPRVQETALQALRSAKVPQEIPKMVELTKSKDRSVVCAASHTLSKYDTAESTMALITLTHHTVSQIVSQASEDLSHSRRVEARAALEELLANKDPYIRAKAPSWLVYWLRREQADDVLPKLVTLLKDPEVNVRASAAYALGESRRTWLVTPLLEALRAESDGEKSTVSILDALSCHYSKDEGTTAHELIDNQIALVVAAVHVGGKGESNGPVYHAIGVLNLSKTPEALTALRWASESHPNAAVLEYAERSLAR